MGYSMKDLENGGRKLTDHFDRKAEQRGEELANRVVSRTSQGRGLWFLILWPTWIILFLFSGSILTAALEQYFSLEPPVSWMGLAVGALFATAWYTWSYTIRRPFISSMFGCFVLIPCMLYLARF